MAKRTKYKIGIAVLFCFCAVGLYLATIVPEFVSRASDSEFENNMLVFKEGQKIYHEHYNSYVSNAVAMGQFLETRGARVYFNDADVPRQYKEVLLKEDLPFVDDNEFRLLMIVDREGQDKIEFWIVDDATDPKKLSRSITRSLD